MNLAPLQKYGSIGHASRKTKLFIVPREHCASDTWISNEDSDNHFFHDIENFFVFAKYIHTLCIRTRHADNNFDTTFVLPTSRGECATHRNCSHLFRVMNLAMATIKDFSKYKLITVLLRLSDGQICKNSCSQIRTINEFVYFDVQWYLISTKQRGYLLTP